MKPRRIEPRNVTPQRRQRPAVPRDVMQQHQQHVLLSRSLSRFAQRIKLRPKRRLHGEIEAPPRGRRQRATQSSLVGRDHLQRGTHRARSQDLLARHPDTVREHRAKALMAVHQIAQRTLQRRNVQRTLQTHRKRDRVGRRAALKTLQEPQTALRIRQRKLRRTRLRNKRRARRRTRSARGRQGSRQGSPQQPPQDPQRSAPRTASGCQAPHPAPHAPG